MKRTNLRLPLIVVIAAAAASVPAAAPQVVQERQVITITGDPGQAPPIPGLPGQRQQRTGTARVLGRVISTEGTPLRRAQIRIAGQEVASKMALTDADGRYEFRDLPGGRFTVTATKSGFVTVQYGQTRPFESGKMIDLAEKQTLTNIDIVMPRGGVIAGRVVDEFGEPVADVAVTSLRQTWAGGRRRMMTTGRIAQTNDLGQFRLYGLPPGEYFVSATLRGAEMFVLDMMTGPGGPSGSGTAAGYAPTYFPGTPSPADAQKVSLTAGQEVGGTDFALIPVRLSRVAGTVIGADGKPLSGAMVNLMPSSRAEAIMMIGNSARTNNEGAFTISGVTPGDYVLQARTMTIMTSESGGNTVMFSTRVGEGSNSEFGTLPLSVHGDDLTNVVLVTSKGGSAAGKVIFEGVTRPNTLALRVAASTVDMDGPPAIGGLSSGQVTADMTFELKGVAGPRLIRVMSLPTGLMVKAVRLNGTDVTETPIDFKNGEQVSGIEIVIGKATEVSGTVTDASGTTVKDYTIVLFADDPQKWTLPMTRWVAGRRPDQEGRFKIENLPAGTYYAVAVDYIAQGEWGDPDLLERLKPKAKRLSLDEGEVKTIDLKLTEM
jgi:protocatechuate 3,4-dioxygenase beta subunit